MTDAPTKKKSKATLARAHLSSIGKHEIVDLPGTKKAANTKPVKKTVEIGSRENIIGKQRVRSKTNKK